LQPVPIESDTDVVRKALLRRFGYEL